MNPNQAPKRPGGEMRGSQTSEPSKSQLLPFASNAMELTTKPYFLPGLVVAILVPIMFTLIGDSSTVSLRYRGVPVNVPMYIVLIALMLTAGGGFVIVRMVGKPKAWWTVPLVGVLAAAFLNTPIWDLVKTFFASPMGAEPQGGFIAGLLYYTVAVGFPEEVTKAVMVMIGVYIGRKMLVKSAPNNPLRQIAVVEPLDGILIGAAAGLGFAFFETLFQYIPMTLLEQSNVGFALMGAVLSNHLPLPAEWAPIFVKAMANGYFPKDHVVDLIVAMAKTGANGVNIALAVVAQTTRANNGLGLELVIPRLLSNVLGHSAYAGIFGYFIGLAALKPQNWIKTVLIGLCIAGGLHGLWDAVASGYAGGNSTVWGIFISFASFAGMCTLIMKAREISPNRSQLVASQIIDRMAAGLSRSQLVPQGFGQPGASAVPPSAARPSSTPVPAYSITYDDGVDTLVIEIGTSRVPVALGTRLFERQAPGTRSSRGDSVIGEINANPKEPDVLGIKNVSEQIWHITTQDGERRELVPGRSVRLLRGMRILIGDLVAEIK
jgi:RsiW-degrading membrane proteinase PrsW (M82 family)